MMRGVVTTVALLLPSSIATSGAAQTEPQDAATRFAAATAAIKAHLGPLVEFRAPLPKLSPDHARHLSQIDITMKLFGTSEFPVNGITSFEAVCGTLNEISIRYSMTGAGLLKDQKATPAVAAQRLFALQSINARNYQDEMALFVTSNVKCMALHLPFFENFVANLPATELTPIRKDGLKKMRRGMANTLIGMAASATEPGTRLNNRILAMQTVSKWGKAIAGALPIADRQASLAQVRSLGPALSLQFGPEHKALVSALDDKSCSGLCKIE